MSGDGTWMNIRSYDMPKICSDFIFGCGCYLLIMFACIICAAALL